MFRSLSARFVVIAGDENDPSAPLDRRVLSLSIAKGRTCVSVRIGANDFAAEPACTVSARRQAAQPL